MHNTKHMFMKTKQLWIRNKADLNCSQDQDGQASEGEECISEGNTARDRDRLKEVDFCFDSTKF